MPKRFTDTDKWKKSFIKNLPAEYKLFWLYILDECDHSGIWHVEMELLEVRLGIKLSLEKIRGLFAGKVVEFDSGNKMFVPDFIEFQYGKLNPENKVHRSVISNLTKYKLMGHVSPLEGAKDKDKEKEKDKDPPEEVEKIYPIEQCIDIALIDGRWTKATKATREKLQEFNQFLETQSTYEKNPKDYKKHYANWSKKGPAEEPAAPNGDRYAGYLRQNTSTGTGD